MLQALAIRVSINDGISFLNLEHWYCSPTFGRLGGFCRQRKKPIATRRRKLRDEEKVITSAYSMCFKCGRISRIKTLLWGMKGLCTKEFISLPMAFLFRGDYALNQLQVRFDSVRLEVSDYYIMVLNREIPGPALSVAVLVFHIPDSRFRSSVPCSHPVQQRYSCHDLLCFPNRAWGSDAWGRHR